MRNATSEIDQHTSGAWLIDARKFKVDQCLHDLIVLLDGLEELFDKGAYRKRRWRFPRIIRD
jgi:hypothetical protein